MEPRKKKISYLICIVIIFLGFLGFGKTIQNNIDLSELDRYFEKARIEWKIPGMAIAILKGNRIVMAKGYGLKEYRKKDRVDEKTIFAIASNTKAFTAAMLGILVDEEKINWDDKVRKYIPYFQLYNPYVTEEMTIRDLLCHRCGLRTFSGDLLWYETSYSSEEIIKRARFLKPAYGFRAGYGYSNIMFMAAGEIFPSVTGKKWKDYIKEKIFQPLEMKTSSIGSIELKKYDNVATPHYLSLNNETISVPFTTSDTIASAGGINSNVIEIAAWLKMLLNNGIHNGTSVLSNKNIQEMWANQNIIRLSESTKDLFPSVHFRGYGLGWGLFDYHGFKVINHGGGLDGMISQVALVPEQKLGLVILTNSINYLPTALMYKIIDTYLGKDERDWSQIYLNIFRKSREEETKRLTEAEKNVKKEISQDIQLEDFEGIYNCSMYGDAMIELKNGKLKLEFIPTPVFVSDLYPKHHDIFYLKLRNPFSFIPAGTGTVQFLRNMEGKVEKMKIDIPNNDFLFNELKFKRKSESGKINNEKP